eukprot:COSAG02_NODE_2959_length_7660_cov_1.967465_4_plen_635_part_00
MAGREHKQVRRWLHGWDGALDDTEHNWAELVMKAAGGPPEFEPEAEALRSPLAPSKGALEVEQPAAAWTLEQPAGMKHVRSRKSLMASSSSLKSMTGCSSPTPRVESSHELRDAVSGLSLCSLDTDGSWIPSEPIATRLGTFVSNLTLKDIPEEVISVAERCILDVVGCMLAGGVAPPADRPSLPPLFLRRLFGDLGGGNCSALTAEGLKNECLPATAAFVNGVAAHAHDFDDYTDNGRCHGAASIFPAALAAAEMVDASGEELLVAFIAGSEAQYAIGANLGECEEMYLRGFWMTGVLGPIGAAAAAARVLRLTPGQAAHAIALAAGGSGGLRGVFGSDGKAYGNGKAAQAGIEATLYAEAGCHGALDIFESKNGFAAVLNDGVKFHEPKLDAASLAALLEGHGNSATDGDVSHGANAEEPGAPKEVASSTQSDQGQLQLPSRALSLEGSIVSASLWHLTDPGISFKAMPICSAPQAAAEAAGRLVGPDGPWGKSAACEATAGGINQNQQSKGLDPQQIQRIVITAPPPVTTNAQHPEPTTPHEARFSLQWPVACMVRFGKVGLQEVMRPEALNDAVLRMVMKTIEVVAAKGWEAGNPSEQGALVRIEAKDGSSHELLLESAASTPSRLYEYR